MLSVKDTVALEAAVAREPMSRVRERSFILSSWDGVWMMATMKFLRRNEWSKEIGRSYKYFQNRFPLTC